MKILVCVKQVPELEGRIRIDPHSGWIDVDGSTRFRMNRSDEFAVEEAVAIKEAFPGVSVDVITVGLQAAGAIVKRALGMGADNGIHVVTEEEGFLSAFLTASWIASYARDRDYELILTGVMSEDLMQGQVGPMIAELLSIPCATSVIFERIPSETGKVSVEREIEGGMRDTLELTLPALLSVQSGINKPRYPSLSNIMRAKRSELRTIEARSIHGPEPREHLAGIGYPERSGSGTVLEGTPREKARQLLTILSDRALI